MYRQEQTDTLPAASAVKVEGLTKEFRQWKKKEKKGIRDFFRPEYQTIKALDEVSFTIEEGEFVAYAGSNGAGKSTTMRILSGMLLPSLGRTEVMGKNPQKERIAIMRDMGILFGNRSELWWDHTVRQSFEWKKAVWDIEEERYRKNLELFTELLDLEEILNNFARELSLGQRMKADLALMLMHDPKLILLDEPTIGLDVLAKRQMIAFLKKINRENKTTVIVTSHDMDDLEEMAERILLVSKGKLAFDGTFQQLRTHAGARAQITILYKNMPVRSIPGLKFMGAGHGKARYQYDRNLLTTQQLLARLAVIEGIEDIEIGSASIEEIVADLYTKWRA